MAAKPRWWSEYQRDLSAVISTDPLASDATIRDVATKYYQQNGRSPLEATWSKRNEILAACAQHPSLPPNLWLTLCYEFTQQAFENPLVPLLVLCSPSELGGHGAQWHSMARYASQSQVSAGCAAFFYRQWVRDVWYGARDEIRQDTDAIAKHSVVYRRRARNSNWYKSKFYA